MGVTNYIKNKVNRIIERKTSLFNNDVQKQKIYINKFNEPDDDIQRSFNQYKCQMKLYGVALKIILNIGAFILNPIYLIKLSRKKDVDYIKNMDAIGLLDGKPANIIPECIRNEYINIKCFKEYDKYSLNKRDVRFIINIFKKHPFSFLFIFKSMIKIAKYSDVINKYKPKAIVVCAEYSFTSSILTTYCENYDIKHINVMHGEKLYYIRDSFFRYHKCYIWNDYYKKLFNKLRAESSQFIVSVPKSLSFAQENLEKKSHYTYYLAAENKEEMLKIRSNIKKLRDKGYKLTIRPHPRYTNLETAKNIFKGYDIQDGKTITIEQSLLSTKCAISLYSTVLNQAYNNNIEIIIDDMSCPVKYKKLEELEYFCLNVNHKLLSGEVKSNEIN